MISRVCITWDGREVLRGAAYERRRRQVGSGQGDLVGFTRDERPDHGDEHEPRHQRQRRARRPREPHPHQRYPDPEYRGARDRRRQHADALQDRSHIRNCIRIQTCMRAATGPACAR